MMSVMLPVAIQPQQAPPPLRVILPVHASIFVPPDGVIELVGYEPDVSAQLLSFGHYGWSYDLISCGVITLNPTPLQEGGANAQMMCFKIRLARDDLLPTPLAPVPAARSMIASVVTAVSNPRTVHTPHLSRSARRALAREAREAHDATNATNATVGIKTHAEQRLSPVIGLGAVQTRRRGSSSASAASAAATLLCAEEDQSYLLDAQTLLSLSAEARSTTPSMLEEDENNDEECKEKER